MTIDKYGILKKIEKAGKNASSSIGSEIKKVARVKGGYVKCKKWRYKTKPYNILNWTDKVMGYGSSFLSDLQKEFLVELWGLDPEAWPTDWIECVLGAGQRGGKNLLFDIQINYVSGLLVNLEDPYKFLEYYSRKSIPRHQDIDITNNSMVGESQAKEVFFDRMKKSFRNTIDVESKENFFTKYIDLDLREEGLGDLKSKIIEFPSFTRNSGRLKFFSLDSGISTFEGKNILLALIDEPSRARTLAAYNNAKELWKGLTANTSLTYPQGVGKAMAFSYYNTSEYDLTYELIKEEEESKEKADKENKEYTSFRKIFVYSTFDLNPTKKRTDPDVEKKYDSDPEDALARFECIKSKSQFAFFKPHLEKIKECVIPSMQNRVSYTQTEGIKVFKTGEEKKFTRVEIFDIKGDDRYRVWASDTSINKDRFILASGYSEDIEDSFNTILSDSRIPANKRIICDLIIMWSPSKYAPVDYGNVGEVAEKLIEAFPNSIMYASDKHQSESLASIFSSNGIRAETFVFTNQIQFSYYKLLRKAVFNNLVGYINEQLLIAELERVQKINENKIDHPVGFSKDCADCLAIIYNFASTLDYSNLSDTGGLDRYNDKKLIDMIDQFVRLQNESRMSRVEPKDFICESMSLTSEEYDKLEDLKSVYFPN